MRTYKMTSIGKMRKYCITSSPVSKILHFAISIAILVNLLWDREANWHETETQSPCACHGDVMYYCILGVRLILKQLHKTFQTLSAFFGVELFLIMVWKPFCVEVNCIFGSIKLEYERCYSLCLVSVKDSRIFRVKTGSYRKNWHRSSTELLEIFRHLSSVQIDSTC